MAINTRHLGRRTTSWMTGLEYSVSFEWKEDIGDTGVIGSELFRLSI